MVEIFEGYLESLGLPPRSVTVHTVQLRGLAALSRFAPRGRGSSALAFALVVGAALAAPVPTFAEIVAGEVELAPASQREAPPVRTLGFVQRAPNPLKPPKAYDPRPHLVVVLEGGSSASSDRAESIEYPIVGASFAVPIMPVQADVPFEIINRSGHSPRLFAVGHPDILAGEPINPKGTQEATLSSPYRTVTLRDRDSAHIEGAVVAFPHPYFSRVNEGGSFEIGDVPPGTYTAKVWYREGWLDMEPKEVRVSEGERASVKIDIPPRLNVTIPEGEGATE